MFKKYPKIKIAMIIFLPILSLFIFVQFPSPWSQSLDSWLVQNVGMSAEKVPLLEDGRVDFCKIANQRLREGVTVENNMVVDLYQVLPPQSTGPLWMAKFVELLGSPPQLSIPAYVGTDALTNRMYEGGGEDQDLDLIETELWNCLNRPWMGQDQPAIAAWLAENKPALDHVVAASYKPRYYHPLVSIEDGNPMLAVSLEYTQQVREVARALLFRGMNALGEGRVDDALNDLAAVRRMGFRMRQAGTLIEHLVAIAITGMAFEAEQAVLSMGELTIAQCDNYQQIIRQTTFTGTMKGCIENGERLMMLDSVQSFARGIAFEDEFRIGVSSGRFNGLVDWKEVAETCDTFYLDLVEKMGIEDEQVRQKALEELEEKMRELQIRVSSPMNVIPRFLSGAAGRGRLVGDLTVGLLLPAAAQVDSANIRSRLYGMSAVGFEIEKFRLGNNRLPNTLDELDQESINGLDVDWYSGKSIQFVAVPDGYLLYSMGADQVDNTVDSNGVEIASDENALIGDVVLRVKRKTD